MGLTLATITFQEAVIVVILGLAAVFPGGLLVGEILQRIDGNAAGTDRSNIRNAGKYIGWLERMLIFTVIVVGIPGGAAIVIAVKTAARFPQFEKEERFVEYYLIGTLSSLAVVLATALVARAVLGLSLGTS